MSRTNIEFLFQVTAPSGDRGFCTLPRVEELFPPFGDHLSKAASTAVGEPGKGARRDDADNGGAGSERSVSNSSTNDSDSRAESSRSETAVAHEAAADRDEAESDKSHSSDEISATETNNSEFASAEVSKSEEDDETDEENTDELVETSVAAAEVNGNKNAVVAATNDALPETAVAAEGEIQHEAEAGDSHKKLNAERPATGSNANAALAEELVESVKQADPNADPIDSPTIAKTAKTLRPARVATEKNKDATNGQHDAASQKNSTTGEPDGDVLATVEAAERADESSKDDQPLNELGQSKESETGSDEPRRDASARSAGRQRAEAEAIVSKIATTAVANAVAPQLRDDGAAAETADKATAPTKVGATKTEGLADAANRLQANPSSAKRGAQAGVANEMPRVDPARFVGRVAKAFHTAQERGGTLQLRLSPPELGALRLELTVKDGVMTAALETETAAARRVLLEHLPALRDRLAEQNIRIERFDVDVRREGPGGQADPRTPQDRQPQQQGHSERRQPAIQQKESLAPRGNAPIAQPLTNNTGINLVA